MITGPGPIVLATQAAPEVNRILDAIPREAIALFAPALIIVSVIMMITGGFRVVKSIVGGYDSAHDRSAGFSSIIMGIGGAFLGYLVNSVSSDRKVSPAEATPAPTPSASSPPTPADSPTSFSLPQIENMGTLWLIPIAILSLIGIYLLVRKVRHDAQRIRTQREIAAATQERMKAKWQVVRDQHLRLVAKYLAAETEWDQIFLTPALTDPSVPQTAAMLQAMRAVSSVGDQMPLGIDETTDITALPYPKAVARFAQTWAAAESTAVKIGQSLIPAHERRAIEQIRQLLRIAEGTGSSPDERRSAYGRAMKMIQALTSVTVPEKARAAIEQSQRLMLDASTTSQPVPAGR